MVLRSLRPPQFLAVLLLWWSLQATPATEGARILAVESVPGKSHWNFMSALLRSLTDAGHVVTVFTPFPEGDRANYTEVDMSHAIPLKLDMDAMEAIRELSPRGVIEKTSIQSRIFCDAIYSNQKLIDLIANTNRTPGSGYDVFIVEPLPFFNCISNIAHELGLPVIYAVPSPMITVNEWLYSGHVSNPACVSNMMASYAVPATFTQRFDNTFLLAYHIASTMYTQLVNRYTDPKPYDLAKIASPSVIFQNSHYVTESPAPIPSNLIHVGGIHLSPPKTIPKDILDFIEDSPHGVIFFTFGSTVKISSLPGHIKQAFKEALGNVPQRVLWKYEGEMKDMPKNVMVKKWFPQREILLHPKVKLFISHGGMSGMYEAVDGGVPVLGIPLFYDQPRNIENLVRVGMAISINLFSVTREKLFDAISELINDEKYAKNAKIAAHLLKDRPMTPQQSVVYWTEYVIRHKGALHLKSHALNLTWYQYLLLDVIAVALVFVFLVGFVVCKVFKCIYRYAFKNDKVKTQ